ncbi:hypothetical protein [Catenulispora pinisilvae]|uniref:hypothetical protein n=1 Tax=Catenulispora pinisilvae TaxID=2705253 RepID=UPI001891D6E2|nr:hypothetical protein [Catenulispora pinisilvae]
MTQDSVAIPAKEFYAKRTRHYLAERGLDEQVLAAVSIQPAGQSQDTLNRSVGGAVGSVAGGVAAGALGGGGQVSEMLPVIGSRVGRGVANDLNAGREVPVGRATWADGQLPKNGLLVLTSGRLLVFSKAAMGLFNGKPKAAAMDIPLGEVSGVSEPVEVRVAGMNTVQVAIGLRSGGALRVEFPMVAVKNGTALVAELLRRIAPTAA